jgi:hypothetical protein
MGLLSETECLKTASNPAMRRVMGFVEGQRAMQAGLKCDRVPETPELPGASSVYRYSFDGKKAIFAMRCRKMTDAAHP